MHAQRIKQKAAPMEPMLVMAVKTAQQVGAELLKAHQNRHQLDFRVESKGLAGPVTRLDRYAEELAVSLLKRSYPTHRFLGEEYGEQASDKPDTQGEDWCWIIDPLDGTQNFVSGFPHFCVSMAVQKNGVTQHGVIYDPVRDETFAASRNRGATLNNRRIRVNPIDKLEGAFLSVGHPPSSQVNGQVIRHARAHFASLTAVVEAGAQIRRTGSAALDLAYVAAGRFDGFFEIGLKPWDIAAGELIVREAGGVVVDQEEGHDFLKNGQVIAATPKLLHPLLQTVRPYWVQMQQARQAQVSPETL